MTEALVRRFDAPTAQRRAPTAQRTIRRPAPRLVEICPAMGQRLGGGGGCWSHALKPRQACSRLAHVPPAQGRFAPCRRLQGPALVCRGQLVAVGRTVGRIEPLTGLRQQRLALFPYPLRPLRHYPQPPASCRTQARFLALPEGLTALRFVLPLRPPAYMHDAIASAERHAPPLACVPLPTPARSPRPLARWPRTAPPSTHGPRRPLGASHPQAQPRAATAARGHRRHARRQRLTRGRHVQHGEALGPLRRPRVPALTTDGATPERGQQRRGRVRRSCRSPVRHRLWPSALDAPGTQAQRGRKRRGPLTADPTREGRPRKLACPHPRLAAARPRAAG
jgi:hypothetical protein